MKRLWVSGYRSYELGIFNLKDEKIAVIKYALKRYFKQLLDEGELDWVIAGPNLGIEQWALESALELKNDYSIRVAMMSPYLEFSKRWNENNQTSFHKLKENVDFFGATSNSPYQNPSQLRNFQNFMINHTDRALLVYDTEHPGKPKFDYNLIKKYQEDREYPLDVVDFYDLQEAAEEYLENKNQNFS